MHIVVLTTQIFKGYPLSILFGGKPQLPVDIVSKTNQEQRHVTHHQYLEKY